MTGKTINQSSKIIGYFIIAQKSDCLLYLLIRTKCLAVICIYIYIYITVIVENNKKGKRVKIKNIGLKG